MKVNFKQPLKRKNGESLKIIHVNENREVVKEVPMMLEKIVYDALAGEPMLGDDKLSGAEKNDMWKLAEDISENGELDLPLEKLSLIKERVGKYYPAKIVGPAWKILEGE